MYWLRRDQSVPGWATVFGRASYFGVQCNQPPRPTQPLTLCCKGNEYRPKCGDAPRLGSKGKMAHATWINVWVAGKYVRSLVDTCYILYLSALEMSITHIIPRLHDTTSCQTGWITGWTTSWTTGCITFTNIQPVEQPAALCKQTSNQLSNRLNVWQPVVSCKRGIIKLYTNLLLT